MIERIPLQVQGRNLSPAHFILWGPMPIFLVILMQDFQQYYIERPLNIFLATEIAIKYNQRLSNHGW